jgi:mono/diheme cytochrome c family protein
MTRDKVCEGDLPLRHFRWALLITLGIFPLAAGAQQASAEKPLTDVQKLGHRVFEQRCGICHAPARAGFQMYGPPLYKDLVNGSEDAIKEIIRNGSAKMPGFKLGLSATDIDAIVEYLKTVPKPPKSTQTTGGDMGPLD